MQSITVRVVTRFRGSEGIDEKYSEWVFPDDKSCFLGPEKKPERTFTFDGVSSPQCSQQDFYESYAKDTIYQFMNGYNGTIFAYGQSGSGKTYTMLGPEDVTDCLINGIESVSENVQQLFGIIPRTTLTIFQVINDGIKKGIKFSLKCSYLEVYNESINDLLTNPPHLGLKIREYPNIGMMVMGLEESYVSTPEDIFKLLAIGTENRIVSSTNQNQRSSRSHTVFIINLEQKFFDGSQKVSKLNLVDLAGSEKISKTGATGQTLEEAKKINQSLSCLGLCILALTSSRKKHVPYRDSKLTLILKESLGGNSKTTLICACSRKLVHEDETVNTLKFAQRAKKIKNRVCSNLKRSNEEAEALILNLKNEIELLRNHLKKHNISLPNLTLSSNQNPEQPTEEDSSQNYYSQYKELETKYQLLEERTHLELEKLRDQIEDLSANPPENTDLLMEKNEEIEILNQKITEITDKYKYSEFEKDDQKAKYEKQIEIINNESNYLRAELETIKKTIYSYQKEMISLTNEIDLRKKEQKNTLEGYEKLRDLYNKMHAKNEENEQRNKEQYLANENLKKQIDEKNKKLQDFFKEIDDFNKKIQEMEKEILHLNGVLREQNEKEVEMTQQLFAIKNRHKEVVEETNLLKKEREEIYSSYQLKMLEAQDYIKKLLKKDEETNMIIYQLETQVEIYRKVYTEKINLDDEIKANETKLDQLKEKFMNDIESLESEINEIEGKIKQENLDFTAEKTNLNVKFEETKKKIEEEYLKKLQSQEEVYQQLKFQILELELEKKTLVKEKEKNELRMKEIDLENEKRRQEISLLTEELNDTKLLFLKKEEEFTSLQEKQSQIFEEINEKFKAEVKKSEEDLNEMRLQIENHMNKEWDLQIELKKQQKFYELEKENLIRKTQQYEDLMQEYNSLKAIHEQMKIKLNEYKSFSINLNESKQSPLLRQTYQPGRRSSKIQRTLFITKPVQFQEKLFGKTVNAAVKSNESMSVKEEKEIKITKTPMMKNIDFCDNINNDAQVFVFDSIKDLENLSHQSLSPKSFNQQSDISWSSKGDEDDENAHEESELKKEISQPNIDKN